MAAADEYFHLIIEIYVVTYFYLLNLYNTLWPAADNDPHNPPPDGLTPDSLPSPPKSVRTDGVR